MQTYFFIFAAVSLINWVFLLCQRLQRKGKEQAAFPEMLAACLDEEGSRIKDIIEAPINGERTPLTESISQESNCAKICSKIAMMPSPLFKHSRTVGGRHQTLSFKKLLLISNSLQTNGKIAVTPLPLFTYWRTAIRGHVASSS
jgi:hypothetical protein